MRRWGRAIRGLLAIAVALVGLDSCGTGGAAPTSRGADLFDTPAASLAPRNRFACGTCHAKTMDDAKGAIFPGAPLAGVTERPGFWGGAELDLRRSLNFCRAQFMVASEPWAATDPDALALYTYLSRLSPAIVAQVPFTVVREIVDLPPPPPGAQGALVFDRACRRCHGERGTGAGALTDAAPPLPDAPLATHAVVGALNQRLFFLEKVRHGSFLGYDGLMPPFSREALSDLELAQLLAWFGFY